MTFEDVRPGPLLQPFQNYLGNALTGLQAIVKAPQAELYYASMAFTREDPTYFLATKDEVLAKFGMANMIRAMVRHQDGLIRPVLVRDRQGNFALDTMLLEGLVKTSQQPLCDTINYAYDLIGTLPQDPQGVVREFMNYSANRVIARFKDFRRLVNPQDIIPDFDEHMAPIVTTAEGCRNKCVYCEIGGNLQLYSPERIAENISLAKSVLLQYHPATIKRIHEGFINASDLLWHKDAPGTSDPLEIVAAYMEAFSHVYKLGTFFGVDTLDKVDLDYLVALNRNAASSRPGPGKGITTGYVGIETAHEQGSRLMGKNHSFEKKKRALLKLKGAGIAVKEIYQVGLFGKGFYPTLQDAQNGTNFVPVQDALERTVELIAQTAPYRVLLSVYQDFGSPRIKQLVTNGQLVPYDDFTAGVKAEVRFIESALRKRNSKGLIAWQGQYAPRQNNVVPLEHEYEEFVKNRRRLN